MGGFRLTEGRSIRMFLHLNAAFVLRLSCGLLRI